MAWFLANSGTQLERRRQRQRENLRLLESRERQMRQRRLMQRFHRNNAGGGGAGQLNNPETTQMLLARRQADIANELRAEMEQIDRELIERTAAAGARRSGGGTISTATATSPRPNTNTTMEPSRRRTQNRTRTEAQVSIAAPTRPSTNNSRTSPGRSMQNMSTTTIIRTEDHFFTRTLQAGDNIQTIQSIIQMFKELRNDQIISQTTHPVADTNNNKQNNEDYDHECPICMERYKTGDVICWSKQNECDHIFHSKCLLTWLNTNECCPLCRTNIR